MREVLGTLKHCRNTAPGEEIRYEMLQHLNITSLEYMLTLFNVIRNGDEHLNKWRSAVILAFIKPNKLNREHENYRPIAQTSSIDKLIEKIVNISLMNYVKANSMLFPYQYGFWRIRSAPDSLIRLSSDIAEALAEREQLVCIFFDMKKAYNTTWRYGILKVVHECGVRGYLAYFIMNFLRNRQFRLKFLNTFSSVHL